MKGLQLHDLVKQRRKAIAAWLWQNPNVGELNGENGRKFYKTVNGETIAVRAFDVQP